MMFKKQIKLNGTKQAEESSVKYVLFTSNFFQRRRIKRSKLHTYFLAEYSEAQWYVTLKSDDRYSNAYQTNTIQFQADMQSFI